VSVNRGEDVILFIGRTYPCENSRVVYDDEVHRYSDNDDTCSAQTTSPRSFHVPVTTIQHVPHQSHRTPITITSTLHSSHMSLYRTLLPSHMFLHHTRPDSGFLMCDGVSGSGMTRHYIMLAVMRPCRDNTSQYECILHFHSRRNASRTARDSLFRLAPSSSPRVLFCPERNDLPSASLLP